jgi:DNA-binding NarL/FixJ family response regulator
LDASKVSVLVVDDYEPFRQLISSTLGKRHNFQVIGEASDGLEAVRKAEELKPDLIVLDIGLPQLNGIEAARRIRKLSPESKILFMSQVSSADVAREALGLGAMGYVVKTDAGSDLLASLEAVCHGRRFISKRLLLDNWNNATDAQAPDHLVQGEVFSSPASRKAKLTHSHEVQFYSDEEALLFGFTCFIEAALKAGNPVLVVVTESHGKSILQRLLARGVDAAAAIEQGLYLPFDVEEALSTMMVNDLPDSVQFLKIFGDLLSSATETQKGKHSRVVACGEFGPTLWAQGNTEAAIQVEHLTDELAKAHSVDILCGYVSSSFPGEEVSHLYERICAEHSAIRSA